MLSKTILAGSSMLAGALLIAASFFAAPQKRPVCLSGLTKTEAEDVLDWLEANGYPDYKLSATDRGFAVSYNHG